MKKVFLLLVTVILAMSNIGFSQTTIFEDNFDSYTVGDGIASQSTDWETWSSASGGGAEDALVSSDQSSSASNSVNIVNGNDIVYKFGNKNSGRYTVEFKFFVVADNGGSLNFEHEFQKNYAFNIYFTDAGNIDFKNSSTTETLTTFSHDTWNT